MDKNNSFVESVWKIQDTSEKLRKKYVKREVTDNWIMVRIIDEIAKVIETIVPRYPNFVITRFKICPGDSPEKCVKQYLGLTFFDQDLELDFEYFKNTLPELEIDYDQIKHKDNEDHITHLMFLSRKNDYGL